ncbi:glycosyl hydrolase [Hydrotalea flava]|uniref:glycosyl hydrolase n=1 Tax=Hydrotalea flava TaxID=714549 RepID=UPI00142EE048|nr:glycosyl hydrolase [Hydrotalea flava]
MFLVFVSTNLHAQPVDVAATKETLHLYQFLQKTFHLGILFGHQDDLAYGVNWKYVDGNSDVQSAVGAYPAVYGWELGRIENDATNNIDGVPFAKMRQYIQTAYERGGIITISWHLNNPLTGKTAWDPVPGTVASILPGGEKNAVYNSWLDKVANFLQSLTGKYGEAIPVIFRPFHELNGNWFWWGKAHCTPDEMIRLYRYTEHYLKDVKNIHHLLYAFNTDQFANLNEYEERYPGNAFVDIVGFDIYQRDNNGKAFVHNSPFFDRK